MIVKKNDGFTLIELIVVIVILGILSAAAAPKFINLQSDAKIACLQGLKGAIHSANNLVRGKAIIQGVDMNIGWVPKADNPNATDYEKTPYVEVDGIRYGMNKGYLDRLYVIAFLQGGQGFETEIINGKKYAKQKDSSNTANTLCRSVNQNKICEYDWCACAGSVSKDYDSEYFVPKGVNIKDATNSSAKCYLVYRTPANPGESATMKIESSGC